MRPFGVRRGARVRRWTRWLTASALLAAPALVGAAVTPATAATPPMQVGLGDSYAAGPLITPQDPTLPGVAIGAQFADNIVDREGGTMGQFYPAVAGASSDTGCWNCWGGGSGPSAASVAPALRSGEPGAGR